MNDFIKKYIPRPIVTEAIKYEVKGEVLKAIADWSGNAVTIEMAKTWKPKVFVHTTEGDITASPGDYIVKDSMGNFYPCKPNVFEKKYTEIDESMVPEFKRVEGL